MSSAPRKVFIFKKCADVPHFEKMKLMKRFFIINYNIRFGRIPPAEASFSGVGYRFDKIRAAVDARVLDVDRIRFRVPVYVNDKVDISTLIFRFVAYIVQG